MHTNPRPATARKGPRHAALVLFWVVRFIYYAIKERSCAFLRFYPGYHGSTIPSRKSILAEHGRIFDNPPADADGIRLNRDAQQRLLERFVTLYPEFTPPETQTQGSLYFYGNAMFGFPDGFTLYAILRTFRPARVIEIGSGFSSALMLDIAHQHLPDTRFTFIDPYSQTIGKVLASRPEGSYELIRKRAQDINLARFSELGENDVLFIDTSHAMKIGSDLSTIFFSILPALAAGVLVHIHDIYFPWEYPEGMVMAGRTYNEVYFVRAFLQYNDAFEIVYNTSQMEREHADYFAQRMPGYYKSSGQPIGQSLWLRKVRAG